MGHGSAHRIAVVATVHFWMLALQAVEDLVVGEDADGIVVVDDAHAAQIVLALSDRGFRVPEDVAVVGL